ncbi:MAG: aldolase/citrate lyase family protein [Candidatus Gorgyraea atricola]|nr:aldolase/citrate lyase family protein [Candidatus Gorgyraea atricola]
MKNLKERLRNGEMVIGTWNGIPSASVVNAIASSGVDFIVIDSEHGPVSVEKAEDLVRACEACGVDSIIRVSSNSADLILRALDIGTKGVQVPHVSTKEEAEHVVRCSKYYPEGERGYSPFTKAGNYGIKSSGHAKRSNENTTVVLNIEGSEGLKNIKDIASVRGIDVIFIGPYDLSQSLGKPGEVNDPEVIKGIRESVKITKNKGVACGSFACDMKYMELLIDCGVQYVTYMVDSALIAATYKDIVNVFNAKKEIEG